MSGSTQYTITITGFRNARGQFAKFASELNPAIQDAFDNAVGPQMLEAIRDLTPVDTGFLADSWYSFDESDANGPSINFANDAGYLDAVLKGRAPGPIPKEGTANMHFFAASGDEVFIKDGTVWHPGTQPNNFLAPIDGVAGRIAVPEINRVVSYTMMTTLTTD